MATIPARLLVPVLVQNELVKLGERVTIARKARGMTQVDLARQADVGLSTVASVEAGYHGVSFGNIVKVLNGLGLLEQMGELLRPEKDPEVVAFATNALAGRR